MTPAELRDLRVRAITPTEEEVVVVLDALRRWAVRRTEFGDLSLSFSMSDFPAVYDLIHKAAHGSLSSGSLRQLVRDPALYNAMSQALDRLRDDGFTVEVRYHGTTGPRLPEIGNASATGMATDASLNVTVSWAD